MITVNFLTKVIAVHVAMVCLSCDVVTRDVDGNISTAYCTKNLILWSNGGFKCA